MAKRAEQSWKKREKKPEIGGGTFSPFPSVPKSAPIGEKPKQPEVMTGPGPREDFGVETSAPKPPANAGVTKPAEPRTKESILKKYGVEPSPKSWSPTSLAPSGRKPAQPQTNIPQAKVEHPGQRYQRGVTFEKKKASPYDLLPTPQGRDEKEELRMESRQRTQLAKGVSPQELARKEAVDRERTYQPTAADLDIQHELLLNDLERVEQLLGQASIAQESAPGPEQDRQMEGLRQWRNSLLDQRDEIAGQYYYTENQEKRSALGRDPEAQGRFQSIEELGGDMSKLGAVTAGNDGSAQTQRDRAYLMEKYGLTERELERQAPELVKELQSQRDTLTAELKEAGYDYGRMEDYDQMLADAQRYQVRQENLRKFAQEHPVLASAVSIGMAPFQGAEFVGQALGSWGHSDTEDLGSYVPMNPYNMNITNTVNTLRGTVAEEIEKNTDWELFGQNVASFLYQTGMSIGDSALQVGTLGRAATLFMGGSAAASQAQSVMARGGSNRQALWGGLAAGAAEVLFEYVSVDNLLKPKTVTDWKSFLRETAKQAGVEGSEELFTEVANILSDAAIMRDKSETALREAAYEASGLSRQEAEKRTFLDCVNQAVWAAAGGVVSGGVMGGVTSGVSWAGNVSTQQGTELVSDRTVDELMNDRSLVDFLTRKGGLELTREMSREQKQAAVRDAVERIAQKKTASTEETVKVGRATILKNPYVGEMPVQGVKTGQDVLYISDELVARSRAMIAYAEREAKMGHGAFKNLLTRSYEAIFRATKHVEVSGLTFREKPYYVDINNGVPAKVISDVNHSPEKLALLEVLPSIVRNGEYVGSTVGKKKVTRYDHFEASAVIQGKTYLVLFETEVYPGANNYKTHRLIDIELVPQTDGDTGTPPAPSVEALTLDT